jgi:hypothetical protein
MPMVRAMPMVRVMPMVRAMPMVRVMPFMRAPLFPIPKGLRNAAQGCGGTPLPWVQVPGSGANPEGVVQRSLSRLVPRIRRLKIEFRT